MLRLNEDDSLPFVDESTDRHIRLCTLSVGGDKYANAAKGPYDEFTAKLDLRKKARRNLSGATDVIWFHNGILNEEIRKIQRRAKDYDIDHPGDNTCSFLLPGGKISGLIATPVEEKPAKIHEISLKIASLGNTHPLFPLAAEVNTAIDNCNAKFQLRDDAENAYKDANTAAYIAKVAVVRQYNANYFNAASDYDKEYAEKLFPPINHKSKDDDEDDDGTTPGTK